MEKAKSHMDIGFLSTYPPRECGVATFTEELVTNMDRIKLMKAHVIAMRNTETCTYGDKVIAEIRQDVIEDYKAIALKLNTSRMKMIVIQHDFDIYGGQDGEYVLEFLKYIELPVVTILQSLYSEPTEKQRHIINALGQKSVRMITMSRNTKTMLEEIYGISSDKIEMIQHGVPKRPFQTRDALKKKFGLEDFHIVSTIGFVGPEKGMELGIETIAKVVYGLDENTPPLSFDKEILYLILGQNHPSLGENGPAYRQKLEDLIRELQVYRNVRFVNKYLSKEEIIEYLQLTDVYLTPYLEKDQTVSCNLAYAVGYGKAVVSTPYLYAKEMLSEGGGMFADYGDTTGMAKNINAIFQDHFKQSLMEKNTSKIGRTMYWDKVAIRYATLLTTCLAECTKVEEIE